VTDIRPSMIIQRNAKCCASSIDARPWARPGYRIRCVLTAYACAALMSVSLGVKAEGGAISNDVQTPSLLLSAFGTLGVVHSSEADADFTSSVFKPNGAGYTHAWSADVDSIVGGQAIGNITSQLSGMVQVISEQRFDGSYKPYVEWANIKYQITSDLSIRLGRIVLPSFLVSDTRNIGYANAWVRPPIEFYGLVPVGNSDGGDASYRFEFGDLIQTVSGSYGQTKSTEPDGGTAPVGHIRHRGIWRRHFACGLSPGALDDRPLELVL
jgi:hypothetical protein